MAHSYSFVPITKMSVRGIKRTADMISRHSQPITEYLESELDTLSPLSVLGVALKPGISITADSPNPSPISTSEFVDFGYGNSSSVFHKPRGGFVVKKLYPSPNCANHELVSNAKREANMTIKVFEAFNNYQSEYDFSIKVPRNAKAIEDWEAFWHTRDYNVPHPFNTATPAVQMDMIYSLPKAVGRALIQQFHPKRPGSDIDPYVVEEILNQYRNQHCLVQPCLGLELAVPRQQPGDFTLANFELSLEDMRNIGINVVDLAGSIGQAFALLHYHCRLYSKGVQFAFGTSPTEKSCPGDSYTVGLYLFDFRECDTINSDKPSERLCLSISTKMLDDNRKFIPSPLKSPTLFKIFKDAYIKHAEKNMDNECDPTPQDVMKHYEMCATRWFV